MITLTLEAPFDILAESSGMVIPTNARTFLDSIYTSLYYNALLDNNLLHNHRCWHWKRDVHVHVHTLKYKWKKQLYKLERWKRNGGKKMHTVCTYKGYLHVHVVQAGLHPYCFCSNGILMKGSVEDLYKQCNGLLGSRDIRWLGRHTYAYVTVQHAMPITLISFFTVI